MFWKEYDIDRRMLRLEENMMFTDKYDVGTAGIWCFVQFVNWLHLNQSRMFLTKGQDKIWQLSVCKSILGISVTIFSM